jgi:hypothetical protein
VPSLSCCLAVGGVRRHFATKAEVYSIRCRGYGFALHLTSLLLDRLGKDLAPCLKLAFHRLEDRDVGRLEVLPSPRPVFLTEAGAETLYLRAGNSTRPLSVREVLAYEKRRWGASAVPDPQGS